MDTILPSSSTQLCPHLRLQSFSITLSTPSFAQLHSSSSCAFKQEESLLFHFSLSLLYFNWHSLAYKKGYVLYISNPKSHVPPDHVTKTHGPYALAVCKTQSCCPPSRHGIRAFLRFSLHQHGGNIDNHLRPCHSHINFKTSITYAVGKGTQVRAKGKIMFTCHLFMFFSF